MFAAMVRLLQSEAAALNRMQAEQERQLRSAQRR